MAVRQSFVSRRFPYLPRRIEAGAQRVEVEALIDTGFDGDVVLPVGGMAIAGAPEFAETWMLAGGSENLCADVPRFRAEWTTLPRSHCSSPSLVSSPSSVAPNRPLSDHSPSRSGSHCRALASARRHADA